MDKPWLVDTWRRFSVITHFEWFTKGVLDSRDVIFFLSVIGFSLVHHRRDHSQPSRRLDSPEAKS